MNALGLLDPGQIGQNALLAFDRGRQMRQEEKGRQAATAYARDPSNPDTINALAEFNPEMALQARQQLDQQQAAGQRRQLIGQAYQGNADAMAQLYGIDPETAARLDDRTKAKLKAGADFAAQAAFGLARLPEAQRAAAWDQYIDRGVAMGIAGLEGLRGQYSPEQLNAMLAQAGQMDEYQKFIQPDTVSIAPGAGLYSMNPMTQQIETLVQPNYGGAAPFSPVQGGGPQVGQIEDGHRFKGGNPADPNNWESVGGGAQTQATRPFVDPNSFSAGRMTSGRRTPEGNRAVGGKPNSFHLSGDAVDYVPARGQSMEQLAADARRHFPHATEIINEGDHVHVAQRGYGRVPYFGRNGTRGR